jgi:hypothetical protein
MFWESVLVGPSTSGPFSADAWMTVKNQELSKAELLGRLDRRSRSRYNAPFLESLFDDLQKDDLIPALERSQNVGLSPTFFATWRHYRRALQLQRLRSVEIKGRDALRVQLFVRGYGLEAWEVREALRKEFLRGLRELRPQLKSGYFSNSREPGPRHLASAERQLGIIDSRFESAELKQPTDFYLGKVRLGFGAASCSPLAEVEGILSADQSGHPLLDKALSASDDDYSSARAALAWMQRGIFQPMLGRSFLDSPNWPTLALVTILVLQHMKKSKSGFTAASILSRIAFRVGFERLARTLRSEVSNGVERNGGSKRVEENRDR